MKKTPEQTIKNEWQRLVEMGIPVPALPDMNSIRELRSFGWWFVQNYDAPQYTPGKIHVPFFQISCSVRARLGQLKEERAARIAEQRRKYSVKGDPFQKRQGDGESPERPGTA